MFPPDKPPPSRFRRFKPFERNEDEEKTSIATRILQLLFILAGVGIIFAIFYYHPREKTLVCDKSLWLHPSLTDFGTCHKE